MATSGNCPIRQDAFIRSNEMEERLPPFSEGKSKIKLPNLALRREGNVKLSGGRPHSAKLRPLPPKGSRRRKMKNQFLRSVPNAKVNLKSTFGLPNEGCMPSFKNRSSLVPQPIRNFQFERTATACILAGLLYNKRVLLVGEHGSGKSTHIEQVCCKLNWPCVRLSMDSYLTRLELIGKDSITIKDAKPSIKFKYGLLPWAMKRPLALILDDFDACKPEAKFVFNRLLEAGGELIVPESSKLIKPNACFRLFATCNSTTGSYVGTFRDNAAHFDRWQLVLNMPRLTISQERNLIRLPAGSSVEGKVALVLKLLRNLKTKGKLMTALTYRGLRSWCELSIILNSAQEAFRYSYLSKCSDSEKPLAKHCFEATFGVNV
ncbi:MAG: AAA family ATPase [Candidatus Hodgkinia cicadicola]